MLQNVEKGVKVIMCVNINMSQDGIPQKPLVCYNNFHFIILLWNDMNDSYDCNNEACNICAFKIVSILRTELNSTDIDE